VEVVPELLKQIHVVAGLRVAPTHARVVLLLLLLVQIFICHQSSWLSCTRGSHPMQGGADRLRARLQLVSGEGGLALGAAEMRLWFDEQLHVVDDKPLVPRFEVE